jgi:MFS transporter, ACS family, pantothenate transporter
MQLEGRKGKEPYTRQKLWKIFSSWHIYVLSLLYICFNNGNSAAAPAFAQYLKDHKPGYKIWQINVYPTTTYAIQIVATFS